MFDPTLVATKLKVPNLLIVPPITLSPVIFSIEILSPVTIDSSTVEDPSITFPSTGIFSPGFTIITSPSITSSTGIFISILFLITVAILGLSSINAFIASDVLCFAFASRSLPNITIVINTALASK